MEIIPFPLPHLLKIGVAPFSDGSYDALLAMAYPPRTIYGLDLRLLIEPPYTDSVRQEHGGFHDKDNLYSTMIPFCFLILL